MPVFNDADDMKLGGLQVDRVYLGVDLVWPPTPSAFNPWSSSYPTPLHAVWASDPLWSHPGDGNGVSAWRNQSGGGNLGQGTPENRPIFRAATSTFAGRPTVEFVSSDTLVTNIATINAAFKVLAVANLTTNDSRVLGTGADNQTSGGIGRSTGGAWAAVSFSALTGGTANGSPHVFRVVFNGASSSIRVDGTLVASGSTGTPQMAVFQVGAGRAISNARFMVGHVAYMGIYAGSVSDSDLAVLETDLMAFYGIT